MYKLHEVYLKELGNKKMKNFNQKWSLKSCLFLCKDFDF